MKKVIYIWTSVFVLTSIMGCASFWNPKATHPDSAGGKKVTQQEAEQAAKNMEEASDSASGILAILGLPGIATVLGAGGSVAANVWQYVRGASYRDAASISMKALESLKKRAKNGEINQNDAEKIIEDVLKETGVRRKDVQDIYHLLKQRDLI